jgi:hypothetical protein
MRPPLNVAFGFLALFATTSAGAVPIEVDLSTFTADSTVRVAPDGSSAEFIEDFALFTAGLQGDVALPANAANFRFDYVLDVAKFNEEYFDFYVDDLSAPEYSEGSAGPATFGESVSLDVQALAGSTVPVRFQLTSGFSDFGYESTLSVSDVAIETVEEQPQAVPLPGTLPLALLGGAGLVIALRRKGPIPIVLLAS